MENLDNILIFNIRGGSSESSKIFFEKYEEFFKRCSKKYGIALDELYQRVSEILLNPNIKMDNLKAYFHTVLKNDAIKSKIYSFKNELCSEIYDYMLKTDDDYDDFIFESYISSFDESTKEIFRMRFKKEYTYQEIANILDTNISNIYRVIEKNCAILKNSINK